MAERGRGEKSVRSRVLRFGLVLALSIVVWTFAEARSLTTATRTVTLVLAAPAGSPLMAWTEPEQARRVTVSLRLEGSRAALDRAEQRLREPVELLIGDGLPARVGRETVSLREALRDHTVFDRLAVSLVEVSPQAIDVRVDEVVQQTINVRVLAPGLALERPPASEPAAVTVYGPASMLRDTTFDALEAPVPAQQLAELRSGDTTQVPGLAISIPAPWRSELVRVSPTVVTATITLRDTIETHTIPSVPVMVRLSPTQLRQWRVRIAPEDAYLRDVEVRGPGEAIEAIIAGRLRVVATVQLEGQELSAGVAPFQAELSCSVDGLDFVVADRMVPVEIVEASEPEPAGTPGGE
jgi:hypothetical protein